MSYTDIYNAAHDPEARLEFLLPGSAAPERLDKALARLMPEHSRSRLQTWIESGHVLVNGAPARVRTMVAAGACIHVWQQSAPEDGAFLPEPDIDFTVVAESQHWIVIDKPAGLVTHPGAGNWQGTLLNGLLYRYPELATVARAGIVHRLDKNTSGLMVVARSAIAQTSLVRQLQARSVKREYCALVHGHLYGSGTIDMPIGRDTKVPVRMSVAHPVAPKPALTNYAAEAFGSLANSPVAQVCCRLQTGRTHQIRVHMAYLKHPLLGDDLYGGRALGGAARQMLHARALAFADPQSGQNCAWRSTPPADYQRLQQAISWQDAAPNGNCATE